jgi:branched-subunit amino acid aminotransferase/4-amino-4-deoxychorismate lyase
MNPFNSDFDPYDALQVLNKNQIILDEHLTRQAETINQLAITLRQQQQQIDLLIKGLDQANKANEVIMSSLLNQITTAVNNIDTQGKH